MSNVESRAVEIRTDSQYVFDGVNTYMQVWERAGWTKKGKPISNADLWKELSDIIGQRPPFSAKVVKVKGHAILEDVTKGPVQHIDKIGNDKADGLEVMGTSLHGVNSRDQRNVRYRVSVAIDIQRMMVEILEERNHCRPAMATADGVESISSDSSGMEVASTSAFSESSDDDDEDVVEENGSWHEIQPAPD